MLVIRLQRTGRSNLATYRIVVAEKARAVKGKFNEIIGHYLPAGKNPIIKFDAERIEYWVSKGAIPSDTAARLFKREGVKDMEKYIQRYSKKRSKNAPEEVAAPTVPAAAPAAEAAPAEAPAAEAPASETPAETAGDIQA